MKDGGWCYWYPVTKCNATCSSGKQWFQRDCACPVPANGGKPCLGSAEQLMDCNDYDCITPTRGMSGTSKSLDLPQYQIEVIASLILYLKQIHKHDKRSILFH